jgi:hypothetical protein
MNIDKIKPTVIALSFIALMAFGFTACDEGTKPGETNVERSDNLEPGELIGDDDDVNRYSDTSNLEKYYDHADHEDHKDNKREAIGDGAYDGKGDGIKRDEIK